LWSPAPCLLISSHSQPPLGRSIPSRQGITTPKDLRTSTPFLTSYHTAIHAKPTF
ncbi:hypothetical protein L0F63_004218, partial [Massospora cicadina]